MSPYNLSHLPLLIPPLLISLSIRIQQDRNKVEHSVGLNPCLAVIFVLKKDISSRKRSLSLIL
jgi:hypothetical protein